MCRLRAGAPWRVQRLTPRPSSLSTAGKTSRCCISLSHTHKHKLSLARALSLTHTHTHTFVLSPARVVSVSHTHSLFPVESATPDASTVITLNGWQDFSVPSNPPLHKYTFFLSLSHTHTHTHSLSLFLSLSLSLFLSHPLDPMRFTPCRDESMALGFGFGRERESERERERERERGEREKTGYELFFLHAPPHTVGYIVAGVQVGLGSRRQPS